MVGGASSRFNQPKRKNATLSTMAAGTIAITIARRGGNYGLAAVEAAGALCFARYSSRASSTILSSSFE